MSFLDIGTPVLTSTVQAVAVMTRVRNQLIDTGANGVALRWTDSELIDWINEGQRTIISSVPQATANDVVITLVPGVRQPLPPNAHLLLDVYRNMGSGGATPGLAPVPFTREWLNAQDPTWPSDPPSSVVRAWMYDPMDRFVFYVFPSNDGTGTLEINFSQQITPCQSKTDLLTIQDIYQTPLFDYVMMRAVEKDSDYAAGQAVAEIYTKNFAAFLQARTSY